MENGQNRVANQAKLHAIIPAGGAGTRLWPLSRVDHPKFLIDVLGRGWSLLEATILRLAPLSASITIVTGRKHERAVREQIEGLRSKGLVDTALDIDVVAEPSGRDSMPAIGLAMMLVAARFGEDAVVGSFAADHAVDDEDLFRGVVRDAIRGADSGYITTIGVEPTSPSTAFGYIQPTAVEVAAGVYKVAQFVEKPPADVAERYVADGFLWNAGMFVMRCTDALGHLRDLHPGMWDTLLEIAGLWGDDGEDDTIDHLWETVPKIAIDHALAEPVARMGGIAVVKAPAGTGWSDVGDMKALARMAKSPSHVAGENLLEFESSGTFVLAPQEKVVAVVGIDDAVIIDTGDVLLVTTTDHAQSVKDAVDLAREMGLSDIV